MNKIDRNSVLTKIENRLCELIKCDILPKNAYLAGGTAVYFYLKHRVSVDLDFFIPADFNPEIIFHSLKQCFDEVLLELLEKNTIIAHLSKDKIKFSLFRYPYKLLFPLQELFLDDNIKFNAASKGDIEAMKAMAICQRGSAKDFIDMYLLLSESGHSFKELLQMVLTKYELEESYAYQLKTSFVYFEDAEKGIDMVMMLDNKKKDAVITPKEWEKIKSFFKDFVR
ncbi:MAG: hypothetical protein QG657_5692 [Acidobacteriota bacterium]|nr:hypothetical protein [Acidobacteriota bacterium]